MKPVLTARDTRSIDSRAIALGIPEPVLMENAARGVVESLLAMTPNRRIDGRVIILCGTGSNGGDGIAVARMLVNRGIDLYCVLVGDRQRESTSTTLQRTILQNIAPERVISFQELESFDRTVSFVIDAILGTGATGAPRGSALEALRWISRAERRTLAIDLPTGIDADTGQTPGDAVRAERTATMGSLKPGLLFSPGREHAGIIDIVDIGAPTSLYDAATTWLIDREGARECATGIDPTRHKYNRGKVLIVGSGVGMEGAGVLTAHAALRAGAGLSVLAAPRRGLASMPSAPPEIMIREAGSETVTADALQNLLLSSEHFDTVAVGPGLGRSTGAAEAVRYALSAVHVPLILDADGLFPLSGAHRTMAGRKGNLIITPHHGEMSRLLGTTDRAVTDSPLDIARSVAQEIDGIVVLKGSPTIVASPDGHAWISSLGNPGMATAGSGDVLTGVLAASVAKRPDLVRGVLWGVGLHGAAGDSARLRIGARGMIAGDIIDALPQAARELAGDE